MIVVSWAGVATPRLPEPPRCRPIFLFGLKVDEPTTIPPMHAIQVTHRVAQGLLERRAHSRRADVGVPQVRQLPIRERETSKEAVKNQQREDGEEEAD